MRRSLVLACLISFVGVSMSSATMLRERWNRTVAEASFQGGLDVVNSGDPPDEILILDQSAWTDFADNYVCRLSGWLTVPQTGEYTFYYACDNSGGLYISQDEEMAKAVLIASVTGWTSIQQWDKYPTQKAAPMVLTKGQTMAIWAFMEENTGGDNCSIGWTGPGITTISLISEYVTHIAPIPTLAKGPDPDMEKADVPRDSVLAWTPGKYAATHDVYFGTVFEDVNIATREDPRGVLVSRGQEGITYDPPGLLPFGQTYYWRIDEVNAPPTDSTRYKGKVWTFTSEPYGYPIQPILATASSSSLTLTGPEKTIDGNGLDALDQHSIEGDTMWLSNRKGPTPAWIQYEFDSVYSLHEMWVWNSNQLIELDTGYGAQEVTIETSLDGITWTPLEGVPEFAQAPGEETYVHNTTVDFGGVQAKYVKLTIESNWGGMKSSGLSEVRFYQVPLKAYGPTPGRGSTGVALDEVLNWRPGRQAVEHEVYMGTDPNAMTKVGTMTEHRYGLSSVGLEYDKTYTWKVTEVNESQRWEGEVWSFSTPPSEVLDDFESYDDNCNRIYWTWVDGYGHNGSQECGVNGAGGNGSTGSVGNQSTPYAERTVVHGGRQSMPLGYDNAGATSYSEAVRTYAVAKDWTRGGVKTLVVYFHGDLENTGGQLYVKINNSQVVYPGNASSLTMPLWKQWNIDLGSVGGNLRSVGSLTIGVSGSGRGTVYIDDVQLYRTAPAVVEAVDPGTTGLSAYYAMEGDVKDSSGQGNHGTVMGVGNYADVPSFYGGRALQLDGVNEYVDLPIGTLVSTLDSATFAVRVKFDNSGTTGWERIFDFGTGTSNYLFLSPRQSTSGVMTFAIMTTTVAETRFTAPTTLGTAWHHVAVVIDGAGMEVKVYLDGEVAASGTTTVLPKDLGVTTQNWLGRSQSASNGYYKGLLDEFRIYGRALSTGEIRYLAGDRQ